MHSSRMRTGRALTVSCSKFSGGGCLLQILGGCLLQIFGGGCLLQIFGGGGGACSKFSGGVPAPNFRGGGACLEGGVPAWRGGCLPGEGGCLPGGGVPAWRGGACQPGGGVPAWRGGTSPGPPPVDRMTHACENITLAKTSFRPVNISGKTQCMSITSSEDKISNANY